MDARPDTHYRSLLYRFGNPLEWHLGYRCMFVSLIALLFTAWTVGIAGYLLRHSDVATYVSRPMLRTLLDVEAWVYLPGWLVFSLIGLLLGNLDTGGRAPRLVAGLTCWFYVFHILTVGYFVGFQTAIYFGAALLTGLTVGSLLLDPLQAISAMTAALAGSVLLTIGEQLRLIPYAPLLLQAPYNEGHLSPSWVATFGGFDFTLLCGMFVLTFLVMQRWRSREHQLAEANRFLTRFLSPQVARMASEMGMGSVLQKSRSQLTAIECDLRGFTAFSESVAPEEVVDLLEHYYSAIGEAVSEFGGTIKDYSGDGVLVLVGAPLAYADHALRAVHIAFKIRERVMKVLSTWQHLGLDLKVGVGLASGYATVGAIGGAERLEYVAVGPAVNLASRLCERAIGSILVDQRAVTLIGDDHTFHFEPVGAADLKGFSRPVQVFELSMEEHLATN